MSSGPVLPCVGQGRFAVQIAVWHNNMQDLLLIILIKCGEELPRHEEKNTAGFSCWLWVLYCCLFLEFIQRDRSVQIQMYLGATREGNAEQSKLMRWMNNE